MIRDWRTQSTADLERFTRRTWAELEAHELERRLELDLALPTRTGLWQHLSLGRHRKVIESMAGEVDTRIVEYTRLAKDPCPDPQMWHFIPRRSTMLPVCVEEDRTGLVYRASTWRKRKTFPPFTEATTCTACWREVLASKL